MASVVKDFGKFEDWQPKELVPPWEKPEWFRMSQEEREKVIAEWVWKNSDYFAQYVTNVIQEKGIEFVAAAMYHGSVGYYSPEIAVRVIENWLEGLKHGKHSGGSERTICLYYWNRSYEIYSDVKGFLVLDEETQKRYVEKVRKALKGEPWW